MLLTKLVSRPIMIGTFGSILIIDQFTKTLVRQQLALHEHVTVIPNLLDFRYVQNTGAAFGFLNSADIPFKAALMTAVALFALIAIAIYASHLSSEEPLAKLGLASILGGATGNLIDRIMHGYVIDFIDWHWYNDFTWPTFNIADSAISVGVVLLLISSFKQEEENKPEIKIEVEPSSESNPYDNE